MTRRSSRNSVRALTLIAAKSPIPRRVKTRLVAGGVSSEDAACLASSFLTDTLQKVCHSSLSGISGDCWLACDGDPGYLPPLPPPVSCREQPEGDLGERLTALFAQAFAAGYGQVCVIGSDAPHLSVGFVQEAFGRLSAGAEVVFGPADDGGYYLVGLSRPLPALFAGIPWSTETVLEESLRAAARESVAPTLLPRWYDIDTVDDLYRLERDLRRGTVSAPATAAAMPRILLPSRSPRQSALSSAHPAHTGTVAVGER